MKKLHRGCFQNTGFGWWSEGEIAECLRVPGGGDSVKANLVVETITTSHNDFHTVGTTDGTASALCATDSKDPPTVTVVFGGVKR